MKLPKLKHLRRSPQVTIHVGAAMGTDEPLWAVADGEGLCVSSPDLEALVDWLRGHYRDCGRADISGWQVRFSNEPPSLLPVPLWRPVR